MPQRRQSSGKMEEKRDAKDLLVTALKALGQMLVSHRLEKIHLQLPLVYYNFPLPNSS